MDKTLTSTLNDRIVETSKALHRLEQARADFDGYFPNLTDIDPKGTYNMVTSHVVRFLTVPGHMAAIKRAFLDKGWTLTTPPNTSAYLIVLTHDRDNFPDPYQAIIAAEGGVR